MPHQTAEAIENLKRDWLSDPCFDLEDTDGFEDYRTELLTFRREIEELRKVERRVHLQQKSESLGCPGNLLLAEHVEGIEQRLARLEAKVLGH